VLGLETTAQPLQGVGVAVSVGVPCKKGDP
jgi:hypothetical protein